MSLLSEHRLTFRDLASRSNVNLSTVWRWATRGVRGVVLESLRIGGKRFTTEEAFVRFANALTRASTRVADTKAATPSPHSPRSSRSFNEAELYLSDQGIL